MNLPSVNKHTKKRQERVAKRKWNQNKNGNKIQRCEAPKEKKSNVQRLHINTGPMPTLPMLFMVAKLYTRHSVVKGYL